MAEVAYEPAFPVNKRPLLLCENPVPHTEHNGHVPHHYVSTDHRYFIFECDECGSRRIYGGGR